jgi:hypothetical protein
VGERQKAVKETKIGHCHHCHGSKLDEYLALNFVSRTSFYIVRYLTRPNGKSSWMLDTFFLILFLYTGKSIGFYIRKSFS